MEVVARKSAIIRAKCPRCRRGDVFIHPWHDFLRFHRTNKQCPVCSLRFEREPGFFFGAMYVSYAFVIGVMMAVSLILYFAFDDPDLWVYVLSMGAVLLLLLPLIFRYSRIIYLYLFGGVGYDEGLNHCN